MSDYSELKQLLQTYCGIAVLDFDAKSIVEFERLRQSKIHIGTMDTKIAAIAIANDAILLTRNRSDFNKVPNLTFDDWSIAEL